MKDLYLYNGLTVITNADTEKFITNFQNSVNNGKYANRSIGLYSTSAVTDVTTAVNCIQKGMDECLKNEITNLFYVFNGTDEISDVDVFKTGIKDAVELAGGFGVIVYVLMISDDSTVAETERVIDVSELEDSFNIVLNIV